MLHNFAGTVVPYTILWLTCTVHKCIANPVAEPLDVLEQLLEPIPQILNGLGLGNLAIGLYAVFTGLLATLGGLIEQLSV